MYFVGTAKCGYPVLTAAVKFGVDAGVKVLPVFLTPVD